MEYRRFGSSIVARIDRGEEITQKLREIAEAEKITLAGICALGAINDFTVGLFDTTQKKYTANSFSGDHEIVSLTGTVNTMNGEYYSHLHLSAANQKGQVFGGHLNRAVVSATCEMIISIIDGRVDRQSDEQTGLNLFRF